jgi:DNA repair exonuclease SbcCD ATPase subunit
MYRTVAEHIHELEEKRDQLSSNLMLEHDKAQRNHLESELRAVESALTHYRSALEIESHISPA